MPNVIWRPERYNPPLTGKLALLKDGVRLTLKPGLNPGILDRTLETLSQTTEWKQATEWTAIEVVGQAENKEIPSEYPQSLAGMSEKDAQKVIEEVDNATVLEAWLAEESRTKLRGIINRRITEVRSGNG